MGKFEVLSPGGGVGIALRMCFASQPAAPGLILGVPKELSLGVANKIQFWHCTAFNNWAVRKLNNIDLTHFSTLDSTTKIYLVFRSFVLLGNF